MAKKSISKLCISCSDIKVSFGLCKVPDVPHQKFRVHMYFRNDLGVRLLEQVRSIERIWYVVKSAAMVCMVRAWTGTK